MGHQFIEGVRVSKTLYEAKLEMFAQQDAAFADLPEQRSADGRRFKWCPVCNVPAWRRHNGFRVWWSHQLTNGSWCNGLPKVEDIGTHEEEKCPSNS